MYIWSFDADEIILTELQLFSCPEQRAPGELIG